MLRLVLMYLNSIRRVPTVGIRILTSWEQCEDQSLNTNQDIDLKFLNIYGVEYVTLPAFEKIDI